MSVFDRYDAAIAEMDARDGDCDLEDCDTEDADEDGVTVVFGQYPAQSSDDDEPDGPAEVWETSND